MASLGDIATWVGVVASVLLSGQALSVSVRSLKEARRAADAAERAAEAAERQAVAAEMALPPPPPEVAWRLERTDSDVYVLRNIGVKAAFGVTVKSAGAGRSVTRVVSVSDGAVPSEGSLSVLIIASFGALPTDELLVSWEGNPEGVLVPVPRGN